MSRLLTVQQAARIMGLKAGTVRLWIAQRRITCVRLGRAVRVPLDAVETLIVEGTSPAAGEVAADFRVNVLRA